jgi:hypothetical protein
MIVRAGRRRSDRRGAEAKGRRSRHRAVIGMTVPGAMPSAAAVAARGEQSMNREAGPVAFDSPPSSTDTSKVNLSPSSFGDFRTTTASSTVSPSALSTDIVAFGGFLAKLSLPHPIP